MAYQDCVRARRIAQTMASSVISGSITIVGPGGIGKTTVVLAVAKGLLEEHNHRKLYRSDKAEKPF
jgi:DNA replication protein DnaC